MYMKMDKKHILFVVALILLVVSIVYRVMNPFEQARVQSLTYTGEKRPSARSDALEQSRSPAQAVHDTVSRFMDPPLVSAAVRQDLFSAYQPPRPSPAPESRAAPPPDDPSPEEPEQDRHDPLQQIIKDISEYRVFGTFEDENGLSVFLAKGDQVIVAATGDRLEDKYRIDEIEKTHIKILALEVNETIQLDMREFTR
jgi:hypothetical protein